MCEITPLVLTLGNYANPFVSFGDVDKADYISDFITSNELDILNLTKTWLSGVKLVKTFLMDVSSLLTA